MVETLAPHSAAHSLTIVVDDACPVVHRLSWLLRQRDRNEIFRLVGRASGYADKDQLLGQLNQTDWSIMLIDGEGRSWAGPDAIPFILKNLPSGKIAAVAYTVPGTMWLTKKIYLLVSRNRRLLNNQPAPKKALT